VLEASSLLLAATMTTTSPVHSVLVASLLLAATMSSLVHLVLEASLLLAATM